VAIEKSIPPQINALRDDPRRIIERLPAQRTDGPVRRRQRVGGFFSTTTIAPRHSLADTFQLRDTTGWQTAEPRVDNRG
jgi:hypothetical protein